MTCRFAGYDDASQLGPDFLQLHDLRVIRGGSWIGDTWLVRSACRFRDMPDIRGSGLGFRLAQDI
ncbi:MAG: SUMF1/EgtB/PvdO family nonheme iron enzyme [Pseudomonadota bacterium]|nr:SUMF1/EgtB/PvdO family nonheme iron enzyme [Pseudomonadota bacterium]